MNNFLGSWLGHGQLCLEDLIKQVCRKVNSTVQHAMHLSKDRPMCMIHYSNCLLNCEHFLLSFDNFMAEERQDTLHSFVMQFACFTQVNRAGMHMSPQGI